MRGLHDFISPVDQYERGGGRLKILPHTSQSCMLLMLSISAEAVSNAAYQRCMFLTPAVRNSRCQSCQVEDRRRSESFRDSGKERTRKSLRSARSLSATLERPTRLDGKRDERSPCSET